MQDPQGNQISPIQSFEPPASEADAVDITPKSQLFAMRDTVVVPDTSIGLAQYQSGLISGGSTTQAGQGNSVFMIDPQQGIWLGAALFANAPFSVTMAGAVVASSLTTTHLDIPDTTTANSFHVDVNGNAWWGSTALATAVASVTKAGVATFTNIKITGVQAGSSIDGQFLTALSVASTAVAANAITTAKIAALAVTAAEIANSTITGGKIAAATITASNITALTITE